MNKGYLVLLFCCLTPWAQAEEATVAVASNFLPTARELALDFERRSDHTVRLSGASSGKLYAQISNGAPFAIFLSADSERPQRLEAEGLTVPGSRFTYAIGRLALWSGAPRLKNKNCRQTLQALDFTWLAIANPDIAPYGEAAMQVLKELGIAQAVEGKLVRGENIAQTLHFVASGSATLGLVAASQLHNPGLPPTACQWLVPATLHKAIVQQAVLLKRGADNAAAQAFMAYLQQADAHKIIIAHGYSVAAPDKN